MRKITIESGIEQGYPFMRISDANSDEFADFVYDNGMAYFLSYLEGDDETVNAAMTMSLAQAQAEVMWLMGIITEDMYATATEHY